MQTNPRWGGVRWAIAVGALLSVGVHAQEIKGQQGAARDGDDRNGQRVAGAT